MHYEVGYECIMLSLHLATDISTLWLCVSFAVDDHTEQDIPPAPAAHENDALEAKSTAM
jgi:hypothetical protein